MILTFALGCQSILKILLFCIAIAVAWYALRRINNRHKPASAGPKRNQTNPALMTSKDAFATLGLSTDATKEEIVLAHRRLMQHVHPDKGGSALLAQQLNEAKRVLLRE